MSNIDKDWECWSYRTERARYNIVTSMVGNAYGYAQVWQTEDGKCWFGIEDYAGLTGQQCDPLFYDAFIAAWAKRTH